MATSRQDDGSAPTRRLRPWRFRLATRRARVEWQLALVVTAIAVLACTLVSSLAFLVAATELGAVRGALTSTSQAEVEQRVLLLRPTVAVAEARDDAVAAVVDVLGDAGSAGSQSMAMSPLYFAPSADESDAMIYLGEVESLGDHATLTAGAWPTANDTVALPAAAAQLLGLTVGETLDLRQIAGGAGPTVTVVGIYTITDPRSAFWRGDLLSGAEIDQSYPVPGSTLQRAKAVGPAVLAPGALDAVGTPVERIVVRVLPDFDATTVEATTRLAPRLSGAIDDVPAALGSIADTVSYDSALPTVLSNITAAMAVTRSTVVVVSLLLLVLAVAALGQAARLLTEARLGERHLMRARGASGRQVLGLAVVEAGLVAAVTAAASPLLASGTYFLLAQLPAMRSAGMPATPPIPYSVWIVAVAISVVFALVLIAPLLRREGSFHEGEQGKARQRRFSGLQRSGVDVALFVLAAVAYSQLLTYQSPSSGAAGGVDIVLVSGPALVLLAGSFLAVRLVPAAARLSERFAEGARGAVVSLAAWEVARRAQRATAAILLLTLALSVGTFSLSFLSTWRQSQIDQAAYALGAPVRITDGQEISPIPPGVAPVIRVAGAVTGPDQVVSFAGEPRGKAADILGLTAASRETVARLGGETIKSKLRAAPDVEQSVALPEATTGLSAVVRVNPVTPVTGVVVRVRVLVDNGAGILSLIDLGTVNADGEEYPVRGLLADGGAYDGLRIIGYQLVASIADPTLNGNNARTTMEFMMRQVSALGVAPAGTQLDDVPSTPVTADFSGRWRADGYGDDTVDYPFPYADDGWQLGLRYTIPMTLGSQAVQYAQIGWPTIHEIPAVISTAVAEDMDATVTDRLTIIVDGVAVGIVVKGVTDSIPGGGLTTVVGPLDSGAQAGARAIVVDEQLLARALFQGGALNAAPHEWWLDIPAAQHEQYIADLATDYPLLSAQSAAILGVEKQQHPLRVATQGALWLVIGGTALLAAVGFAVHATGSLRSRATEFAQLRAVGLSRRRLVGIIGIESALLAVLGTVFGLLLGVALAYLVAPLVGLTSDGAAPVPAVVVHVPVAEIALLAAELAVVLGAVVLIAARAQRVAEPATALRSGDSR